MTKIQLSRFQGIAVVSLRDLGAMKLNAIADRGLRRDFIDLAALLEHRTLSDMFADYDTKYQALAVNRVHLMKSLLYFYNADQEDQPDTLVPGLDWESVKTKLTVAVRALDEQP